MKLKLSAVILFSAALGSGTAIAQEKAAAQTAAKGAAQGTQVAQAGGAAATTTGGASTGAAAATGAASFGSAVVTSLPFIGITAGVAAVGNASAGNVTTTTSH